MTLLQVNLGIRVIDNANANNDPSIVPYHCCTKLGFWTNDLNVRFGIVSYNANRMRVLFSHHPLMRVSKLSLYCQD